MPFAIAGWRAGWPPSESAAKLRCRTARSILLRLYRYCSRLVGKPVSVVAYGRRHPIAGSGPERAPRWCPPPAAVPGDRSDKGRESHCHPRSGAVGPVRTRSMRFSISSGSLRRSYNSSVSNRLTTSLKSSVAQSAHRNEAAQTACSISYRLNSMRTSGRGVTHAVQGLVEQSHRAVSGGGDHVTGRSILVRRRVPADGGSAERR